MKRIFYSLILISLANISFANINGDGYYRVKNVGTTRWASLVDNWSANVDFIAGTADLHALRLSKNTENTLSDPASIIYLRHISGFQYDVATQGTSLQSLVSYPISIGENGKSDGQSKYMIWGTYQGFTKRISDGQLRSVDEGEATLNENDAEPDLRNWFFIPVDVESDNFFGVVPTIDIDGESYCTLYASFPFRTYSDGMKVYYIGRTSNDKAEMKELTGEIPASTPVLIKCVGATAQENKLEITSATGNVSSNSLQGVYFNYNKSGRVNQVAYDANTMRVLGKCADGSLGFVISTIESIPANTVYLTVEPTSSSEIKCYSTEEYDDLIAGVDNIKENISELKYYNNALYSNSGIEVMNMAGQTVLRSSTGYIDITELPKGVYVAISGNKSLKFVR